MIFIRDCLERVGETPGKQKKKKGFDISKRIGKRINDSASNFCYSFRLYN